MNWQHSKLLLRTIGAIALVMGLMLPMLPKTATPVAEAMNTLVATAPAGPDSAAISGAIYTTLPDGRTVNANHYTDAELVYLSGGPKAHAGDRCRGGDLENGSLMAGQIAGLIISLKRVILLNALIVVH